MSQYNDKHDLSHAERGNGNGSEAPLNKVESEEHLRNMLTQIQTLSPEAFERLYLAPKTQVSGDLRTRFANPTPMAILGFSTAVLPLSIELMGWYGAGGFAAATVPCSIWFGGMLLLIAGIMEWILGNDFPFLVFMGYGAHILTFATTFLPQFDAIAFYSEGNPYKVTPGFANSFGYYPVALGVLSFIFLLGSLRTNLCFVLIFVAATLSFGCATAALFYSARGHTAISNRCLVATGAGFFVADILGWYLFLGMMIQIMELPLPDLPVFDLSTVIKPKSRKTAKEE